LSAARREDAAGAARTGATFARRRAGEAVGRRVRRGSTGRSAAGLAIRDRDAPAANRFDDASKIRVMMGARVAVRGAPRLRRQEAPMADGSDAKTTRQLLAQIATLRQRLAATSVPPKWTAPVIHCVPTAPPTRAGMAPEAPRPALPDPGDSVPRYVPWLTSRFWEETGLDRLRYDTFVETGSYRGDTLDFMKDRFRSLHSVELSKRWHEFCVARFEDCPHVHLYHGSSAELLPRILRPIDRPVIVFLDAHYSGGSTAKADIDCDSPLLGELSCLQSRPFDDIIIIDDTSFFDAKGGEEPQTLDEDQVWPRFAYDWSGITREAVLSRMKPDYGFLENTGSRYTLTPREDQLILYPRAR
jgi:hypothetical protein